MVSAPRRSNGFYKPGYRAPCAASAITAPECGDRALPTQNPAPACTKTEMRTTHRSVQLARLPLLAFRSARCHPFIRLISCLSASETYSLASGGRFNSSSVTLYYLDFDRPEPASRRNRIESISHESIKYRSCRIDRRNRRTPASFGARVQNQDRQARRTQSKTAGTG